MISPKDEATRIMTSPATLESSSPAGTDQRDLVIEESMLKRKAAVLEEFLKNGRLNCLKANMNIH